MFPMQASRSSRTSTRLAVLALGLSMGLRTPPVAAQEAPAPSPPPGHVPTSGPPPPAPAQPTPPPPLATPQPGSVAPAHGPASSGPTHGPASPGPPYGHAQAPAYGPVPIALHSDEPGRVIELYYPDQKPEEDVPLVRCVTPCMAEVLPGKYRVHVQETDATRAGSRVVSIGGPSYVTVTPDSHAQRWVGLGLGIGGVVLIQAGVVLLVLDLGNSIDRSDCIGSDCPSDVDFAYPGLLALLGGLVMTPIGWVVFGRSFSPSVDVDPARVKQARREEIPLIVGGGPRGSVGLSLGARF